jgi:hypothetical protein
MKKLFLILAIILLIVIIAIGGALTYLKTALPDVGQAPELKLELTTERVERGRYLANTVNVCMDCHSTRDWSKFSGPITPGTLGKGGDRFDHSVGFPGIYYSKNITPAGISRYSDGELYRVITTGVSKEGNALFPVMPYSYYGRMDDEDIYSIIAYLRTLDPIENSVQESQSDFPMNFIINTIPGKGAPIKRPQPTEIIAYGAYMINAAGCAECHTQVDKGQIIAELKFSGGREFAFPDGSVVRSANITPDEETGIGKLSKQAFIQKFKLYADSSYAPRSVKPGDYNSIMPWTMYGNMKEEDLSAIYEYLKTVKPIRNSVEKFTPAKSAS